LACTIGRRETLAALAAVTALPGFIQKGFGEAIPDTSLVSTARRGGRFFGAAARIDHINAIGKLREIVLRDCGYLTPEFHMNWDHIHPAPDAWTFEQADQLCAFAIANDMRIRGHLLLWDQSTPQWARDAMAGSGGWTVVQNYLATTLGHYNGTVDTWDVVNEAVDDNGRSDGLRENIFFRAFGPDYVRRAFEEARQHAPAAHLNINDYGFDYDNKTESARRSLFLNLLEHLRKSNTPVDGVGIQAHLDLSKGPVNQRILSKFLQDIADMQFDIVITEMDVLEKDRSASIAARDARVAQETGAYLDVALAQKGVKGIITWGLSDRFSWLQSPAQAANADHSPAVLNRGLPYDGNLDPKPMYDTIRNALGTQHIA
jgi:endo-1,4-beta-xylanase